MPATLTFGATPTMPAPFDAAAMVPAVWVPCPLSALAAAAPWTGAPLRQVAVGAVAVVVTGVDGAGHDRRAAAGDGVRLGRVHLAHVPLEAGERVGVGGRGVRQLTGLGVGLVHLDATDAGGEIGGHRGALDLVVGP